MVGAAILRVSGIGLQLYGACDNVEPIAIRSIIVLAAILNTYCGRLLRKLEMW